MEELHALAYMVGAMLACVGSACFVVGAVLVIRKTINYWRMK